MYRRNAFTSWMYVDLITLYLLAVGTLLASAGMTFWEHRSNPKRSLSLRILSAGFATLAAGCALALIRRDFPGALGSAIANLTVLSGYLLIFTGVASLSGRTHKRISLALLAVMALTWLIGGVRYQEVIWNYLSSIPIALASGLTAWAMLRCDAMKSMQSRYIVVALSSIHALCYAGRALVLPWLVGEQGQAIQSLASKITVYEGVLYSVVLPMTLLKLIRDESHGHLLRESQTDYLTRLGNRRWFFEQGVAALEATAARSPIAVLAFDLDRFKAINDRYGHQAGDEVLKSFADIAQGVFGPNAILARMGGEEFAGLLTGDDARRAQMLGEAIIARFSQTSALHVRQNGLSATVSIGLAQFDERAPSLVEALAAADHALYRAKSQGGNRLELASSPERGSVAA